MKKRNIAIYTAITGGKDNIHSPRFKIANADLICFTDNPEMETGAFEKRIITNHLETPLMTAKQYKVLPDKFLPEYSTSIWMDGNVEILMDIEELARHVLKDSEIACFQHMSRKCLFDEATVCKKWGLGDLECINSQVNNYLESDMPKKYGLYECSIIFRHHANEQVKKFMELWWQEITKYQESRDQISFPYIKWKHNFKCNVIDKSKRSQHFFLHRHQSYLKNDFRNKFSRLRSIKNHLQYYFRLFKRFF